MKRGVNRVICLTGDIHGEPQRIVDFCEKEHLTEQDIIVLLGDVGANYFGGERDERTKTALNNCGPKMLCVHGNHEMRPWNVPGYELKEWNGGKVWVQEEYQSLLFAKDGEVFTLGGKRCIVIGGAYSVDKTRRIIRGFGWWPDEQPSAEIKEYVEKQFKNQKVDVILSHTCPLRYEPIEMFIPGVDWRKVDDSTEQWMDRIEESVDYQAWYCGHWHTDKRVHKMHFLFNSFETFDE